MRVAPRHTLGQYGPAVRLLLLMTALLGIAYPLAVTGVGAAVFPAQANGSLVHRGQQLVGSSLIGQSYAGRPAYFQSRPSAAGTNGYDPLASGASNLALDSPALVATLRQRLAAVRALDGTSTVAPDAIMASGSGLDPQISPAYAEEQVPRIARQRGLSEAAVRALVAAHTAGRTLGFLGEPRVDVLALNLALDAGTTGTLAP